MYKGGAAQTANVPHMLMAFQTVKALLVLAKYWIKPGETNEKVRAPILGEFLMRDRKVSKPGDRIQRQWQVTIEVKEGASQHSLYCPRVTKA